MALAIDRVRLSLESVQLFIVRLNFTEVSVLWSTPASSHPSKVIFGGTRTLGPLLPRVYSTVSVHYSFQVVPAIKKTIIANVLSSSLFFLTYVYEIHFGFHIVSYKTSNSSEKKVQQRGIKSKAGRNELE